MKQFIKDCFTGEDNATADVGRVLWFLGGLVFFFCTVCNIRVFSPMEFATAFSALLVGGAGALKLKQSTEPK
jgi:hypothetical protein